MIYILNIIYLDYLLYGVYLSIGECIVNNKLLFFFSLIKIIYINFKVLPFKYAIKLPIWISYKTELISLKGRFIFNSNIRTGMIRIGFDGAGTAKFKATSIENNGSIFLGENISIGGGCQICTVSENSELHIGSDVKITSESHIISSKKVIIGNRTIISWDTQIMDTDFHNIYNKKSELLNADASIVIGEHVWIASKVSILKGSIIYDDIIISSGSIINGILKESNAIYTGLPIRKIKENVYGGPRFF